ncbi:hypothetical protein I0E98_10060 [Pseudomonas lalucatii]|nr:hypothetical protein [Pseudomonas lalucatii]
MKTTGQELDNSSVYRPARYGYDPRKPFKMSEHYNYEEFERETMSTLKLARSAIIYFVQMVKLREQRMHEDKGDSLIMPMIVPSHHYIRGLDD